MTQVTSPAQFCSAFDAWAKACMTSLPTDDEYKAKWREEFREHWSFISLAIHKSCLLDRLIYGGSVVRTRPCPVHQGRWSGISMPACEHCGLGPCGCNTGWLPEPDESLDGTSRGVLVVTAVPVVRTTQDAEAIR